MEHPNDKMPGSEMMIYTTEDGLTKIETTFDGDTVWLSADQMAELFQRDKSTISRHIKNIFSEGELVRDSVVAKFATTAVDGKTYQVEYYNLDVIISVGYRVKSKRGTQFRIWATGILKEYMRKGFALDDERLKNLGGGGYFKELLERIRDIRASERRVYLRVREIFALAADYQPSLKETTQFFQTIQNKLHFACTGHTAAELIHKRADANQPHMGLTSYKGEEVRKGDVTVAKNYLTQDEVSELNRVVNMWLDFAEDQARRRQQVFLRDWQDKLDQFLQFNDREVLQGAGKISKKMADEKAQAEYVQFAEQQRRLKEAEGEKDIAGLLQWNKESKK